jgi:hexokinase
MVKKFLSRYRLLAAQYDADAIVAAFHEEMDNGLAGKPSSLAMIPSHITVPDSPPKNRKIIVLDAGGTNFRAAVVRFDETSAPHIDYFANNPMPGLDKEVTREEFFGRIAEFLAPVIRQSNRLGFCFSYPAAIDRGRDGTLLYWTKEIKAPGVVGRKILADLAETLRQRNLPVPDVMLVLNDTVASLMAGVAAVKFSPRYNYAGFILGTGTNTSYVASNAAIKKVKDLTANGSQAINVESANFSRIERGDIDAAFDTMTSSPGKYTLEKMVSGAYLGPLCTAAIRIAASEGLLSPGGIRFFKKLGGLETKELSLVIDKTFGKRPEFSGLAREDTEVMAAITDSIVERAAKLTAVNLAAAILTSAGKGAARKKVCVCADGSVYYKLHSFKDRAEKHLAGILRPHGVEYDIVKVEEAPIIGAAVAGLA